MHKILKSYNNNIMVGVAPIDFDINISSFNYGWYIDCSKSFLYSGPPYNYNGYKTCLKKVKEEITVILDMKSQTIKFIIDNEFNNVIYYRNIPIDKPLSPVVFLYSQNDTVEIVKY